MVTYRAKLGFFGENANFFGEVRKKYTEATHQAEKSGCSRQGGVVNIGYGMERRRLVGQTSLKD